METPFDYFFNGRTNPRTIEAGFTAELVKRYGAAGRFGGSFGNEQIVHVLLDEMTAVHGLRNLKLEN